MSIFSSRKGFTLIELLVVIAIIALLSSVVLASLANGRIKARDARRVADLQSLQLAMELYYDKNQTYFVGGAGSNGNGYGLIANCAPAASPSYPKAITQELYNQGFLSANYVNDPLADIEALVNVITEDEIKAMDAKDKEAIDLFKNPPKRGWD